MPYLSLTRRSCLLHHVATRFSSSSMLQLLSMHPLCSVIYTVSRERTVTWRFVTFKLLLDAWQLLMLILNPSYGWRIDGSATYVQPSGVVAAALLHSCDEWALNIVIADS